MSSGNRVALTTMAIVISGFSFVLFTKITTDILFKGLEFCSSSNSELFLGSLALFTSASISGFMASLLVVRDNYLPHILISAYIFGKMYIVISCTSWTVPFFYEVGVHLGMILGVWLGYLGAKKFPLAPI